MKNALICLALCLVSTTSVAGEVNIKYAIFTKHGQQWDIAVTLEHADSGWDHYADAWRVVDERGELIALHNLLHPHEDEQPFTRVAKDVFIAPGQNIVYVEAHDKIHAWSTQRLRVDLRHAVGPGYNVVRH